MNHQARTLRPGEMLGRYSLSARLARGGMGEVWLAAARGRGGFEKRLVLKTIRPERAASPLFVKMFAEEARLTARLNHPNLIDVFDFAEDRGIYFLAMEYLPGRSVSQILKAARLRGETVPDWFILRVLADCCRGLHYAHEQSKILHCDLSPSNVMVAFTGLTKILDFGVAQSRHRVSSGAALNGKFPYMAPERIGQRAADCRSDVYSLGVIMYLAFAGRLPFRGDTEAELLANIVAGSATPPGRLRPTATDVEAVIMRAIDVDPNKRFQSAEAFGGAIESLLARRRGPFIEHDIASYLGSLFPDAPEIPANIRGRGKRRAAKLGGPRADTAATPFLGPMAAELARRAENDLARSGGGADIEILLEDSAISVVEAPEPRFEAPPRRAAPPPLPPEPESEPKSDSNVTRIQQLFETSVGSRVDHGHRAATVGRWIPPRRQRSGIFDGYDRRRDIEAEPWPWANNVKKREEG